MKADVLIAEIGSTTTVLTALTGINGKNPKIEAQGEHYTTVSEGDVTIGIQGAVRDLEKKINEKVDWEILLASSSAAGGLKMTVHGLVYDMTVRAAKEAALGAGAVLKFATAGMMRHSQVNEIYRINPKVMLLAGGVDYGEESTIIHNAEIIANMNMNCPVIYAGNCVLRDEAAQIFKDKGKELIITENVYPQVDHLNVGPARRCIQEVFSKHIIHAPGMEKIYSIVNGQVLTTPGAVMITTELLSEIFGDVLTVDIGGATTDVDSVTDGDPQIQRILVSPEPRSKRSVEGDLGLYVNAHNVIELITPEKLRMEFSDYDELFAQISPYPKTPRQEEFVASLAKYCFKTAVRRHAGKKGFLFGPTGRIETAQGKDLTAVKHIFGTGGMLSRSRYRKEVMKSIFESSSKDELLPVENKTSLYYDKDYIFAPIGILSTIDKQSAIELLKKDIAKIE